MNAFALIALCLTTALHGGGGDGKNGKDGKEKIDVRIRVGATVRGADVTIGELCEITPINRDTLAIGNLVFSVSPIGGSARTVTRTEIVQSLVAGGHDVGQFTFSGPTEIVVQPVIVDIPATELLEAASAALQAVLALEGGDVEVETPSRIRMVSTPPGRHSRELVARVRGDRTNPTSAVVDVDIIIDGQKSRRVPVQFNLQRYQMLLKTVGVVRAGAPLGAQNLQLVREPLSQSTGLYLTRLEDVEGMIAARNLQANSRITLGDTAPPSVIQRGDIVTVVLTEGRVKVTSKAIANHDAPLEGRISLTNLRSRGSLTGIVAGPGLVVVH